MLNADELTYFRYTSWRLTRAICQILANLGGEFEADGPSLEWPSREAVDPVPLAGTWLARIEYSRSQTAALDPSFRDPGNRGFRLGWAAPGPTATGWTAESIPAFWEKWGGPWEMDGAAWFRRTVNVPAPWIGQDLVLELGPVDDFDVTYWNGKEVGATGPGTPNHWAQPRAYRIPGRLVKPGDNTIAVRVFDQWGGGGFGGEPGSVRLVRAQRAGPDFYVPGFRTDFPLGDDPYRYYRW
jgi:hypothetical protein